MQVRLLGPVDVVVDGEPRSVPGLRRAAVLAALALRHGEVVSVDALVEIVWGSSAPSTSRNTLQSHVSYLRGVLGSKTAVRAQPPGYVLDADGGTDLQHAEQLLQRARQATDPAVGIPHLRTALGLWRGRPLADLAGMEWMDRQAARLDVLHAEVVRALSEARLAAGEHRALIPELEQLAAERPLDEQLHAQLMLAMYRSGRQADALAVFQRMRFALAEELGVDPSPSLRDLEVAMLKQDPALDLPAPGAWLTRQTLSAPVPAQLPPVPGFAGRRAELARLDALLPGSPDRGPLGAVSIAAVSGTAGVGKTTLALHWARRVSAEFPDGQLFVNLQGFDPGGVALEPGDALRGFLEAFGVPVARIPPDLPAQAALYRSVLAGQRVLVVLDNARDAEQARPLLPGSPGCMAVVTSRDRLAGLVATEGAYPLTLDLLTAADARDLLSRRVGPARVTREPTAVDAIIADCARLPLALALTAARAIGASMVEMLSDPKAMEEARVEFNERTGGGMGGSRWVAPLLPKDFEAPIRFRWPEYVTTPRGEEWWIPQGA